MTRCLVFVDDAFVRHTINYRYGILIGFFR